MRPGVFIGGIVTAAHLAAGEADAQMHPPAFYFQTLLTTFNTLRSHNFDLINMCTIRHDYLPLQQNSTRVLALILVA
jgi:hypothetical protein